MFSLSHQYVAAYQSDLRTAAAAERLARKSERRQGRAVHAVKSIWSLLSGPADAPATPNLSDYPFRATHAAAR